MDWLAGFFAPRLPLLISLAWMSVPTVITVQGLAGLWRRWKLLRHAVAVDAVVKEVRPGVALESLDESSAVELVVAYRVAARSFDHRLTRTDHRQRNYQVGSGIRLIYQRDHPTHVMDAERRPWDDVIGPLVFGGLLFAFMGWLLLFVAGLL